MQPTAIVSPGPGGRRIRRGRGWHKRGPAPVITGKMAERWKSWQEEMREELVTVRYDVKEDVAAKEHIADRISVAVRECVEFRRTWSSQFNPEKDD